MRDENAAPHYRGAETDSKLPDHNELTSDIGERVRGFIDSWSANAISGWIWDSSRESKRLIVDLVVDDRVLLSTTAGTYRTDLLNAGIGDGRHAFVMQSSEVLPARAVLKERTTGFELKYASYAKIDDISTSKLIEHDIKNLSQVCGGKAELLSEFLHLTGLPGLFDMRMSPEALLKCLTHHNECPSSDAVEIGSPVIDMQKYSRSNPDIYEANLDPLFHFLRYGYREGRSFSVFGSEAVVCSDAETSLAMVHKRGLYYDALLAVEASTNNGFVGNVTLGDHERYFRRGHNSPVSTKKTAFSDLCYKLGTDVIIKKYLSEVTESSATPATPLKRPAYRQVATSEISFSIVTPYYKHMKYFADCAKSVGDAAELLASEIGEVNVEWLVVNNDQAVRDEDLLEVMKKYANIKCAVKSNSTNHITTGFNISIAAAVGNWILFLDCDDRLHRTALIVARHYALSLGVRYISSNAVDIDENGLPLRLRRQNFPADATQQHRGMQAGHLKIIHRDVFKEYGAFSLAHEGCQDFWLALSVGINEKIAIVPDFLYEYRWHNKSVSTSKSRRQYLRERNIVCQLSGRIVKENKVPRSFKCAYVIRTTGARYEQLVDAVNSVLMTGSGQFVPIIVVHGEQRIFKITKDFITNKFTKNSVVILHCERLSLRRGAPLNDALRYAVANSFDAFAIVDDDDIILPQAHLALKVLESTEADFVYGRSLAGDIGDVRSWKEMYKIKPFMNINSENFIPANAWIARTSFLKQFGADGLFPEDMHYLEDWSGLLRMAAMEPKVVAVPYTMGLFTLGSDGNSAIRTDPAEFERCRYVVKMLNRQLFDNGRKTNNEIFGGWVDYDRLVNVYV